MINVINEVFCTEFSFRLSKFGITKIMKMEAKAIKEAESSVEELLTILSPIYTGGFAIEEYKTALLYLTAQVLKNKKNKKKIMETWTLPYIEALLLFFNKLEKNEELMKEAEYFIKNKNQATF